VDELPAGYRDDQTPGHYRLNQTGSERLFDWTTGPQALKPWLFKPREVRFETHYLDRGAPEFRACETPVEPTAFIGVRACDIAALGLQDRHFMHHAPDTPYRKRREALMLVAVNCTHSASTCFCASTGDGPAATHGYDLVLDELDEGFVVTAGTGAGRDIIARLALPPVTVQQTARAAAASAAAARAQTRSLPSRNLRQTLFERLDHPRWEDVAKRCLSCGNCTSVCPTCFCFSLADETAADGTCSQHVREWDSCFAAGHSYLHGFLVRSDTRLRYRQWMTHKLGSWHDQYGRSGCVGCGRCISWCPVGIDITEEAGEICGEG
jgi:ferredoxin